MSRSTHCVTLIVAFGLVLFTPWVAAAQPASAESSFSSARGVSIPADFLTQAWEFVSRLWDKAGCGIDPSGGDEGCGLDPDGLDSTTQNNPPFQGEAGCGIDPSGLCAK